MLLSVYCGLWRHGLKNVNYSQNLGQLCQTCYKDYSKFDCNEFVLSVGIVLLCQSSVVVDKCIFDSFLS